MKLIKRTKIASYSCTIEIRTPQGIILKYINATSSIDPETAERNCYERVLRYCWRVIRELENPTNDNYHVTDLTKEKIKEENLEKKDFEKIIARISPLINKTEVQTLEI